MSAACSAALIARSQACGGWSSEGFWTAARHSTVRVIVASTAHIPRPTPRRRELALPLFRRHAERALALRRQGAIVRIVLNSRGTPSLIRPSRPGRHASRNSVQHKKDQQFRRKPRSPHAPPHQRRGGMADVHSFSTTPGQRIICGIACPCHKQAHESRIYYNAKLTFLFQLKSAYTTASSQHRSKEQLAVVIFSCYHVSSVLSRIPVLSQPYKVWNQSLHYT